MKNTIIIFAIIVVVVGAGFFYGGMSYAKSKSGARNLVFGQRQGFGVAGGGILRDSTGQLRNGGNRAAGSFINGEIIAQDDKSITVKSVDGGAKIIFLAAGTQITKSVDGSITDLELGKNVMITGSANSDGSVTAQSIQLRPNILINATSTPPVR